MAEKERFELSLPVKANTLSRRAVSTTHPPLRIKKEWTIVWVEVLPYPKPTAE